MSNYIVKLIPHLLNRKKYQGFTIIELLVVIIVIGMLSAIALPSFLSCGGNKAITSEAKTYVGSMNRAQQAYYLENNGKFSSSLPKLEMGINEQTKYYNYYTKNTQNAAFSYGIARKNYVSPGSLNRRDVISVVGAVFPINKTEINKNNNKEEIVMIRILCISEKPGKIIPPDPIFNNGVASCAKGTKEVNRE